MINTVWNELAAQFSDEWQALTPRQRDIIAGDCVKAIIHDDATVREYRRNIGAGNLASYVRCLEIQAHD